MYKIAVLVMTKIILAHDQKHVHGHYFLVRPNASPKRTLGRTLDLKRDHSQKSLYFSNFRNCFEKRFVIKCYEAVIYTSMY